MCNFWMELDAYEKRVIAEFDDFNELALWIDAGYYQSPLFKARQKFSSSSIMSIFFKDIVTSFIISPEAELF